MRLVYSADLHGDISSYRALLDLAVSTGAHAAIVGGDLLPNTIKVASAIATQRDFITDHLRPLLASFRSNHPDVAVYLLAGNDDWAAAIKALDELAAARLAFPLHEQVYDLATQVPAGQVGAVRWLAGYAAVPLTPFSIKDYERRDEGSLPPFSFGMAYSSWGGTIERIGAAKVAAWPSIAEALAALGRRSDPRQTIYVCHAPPADTPLDQALRGKHIGSKALRSFIEAHTPPLTLHGHAHESPQISGQYATKIGTTWCVNPGHDRKQFYAVSLDTSDITQTLQHTAFGRPTGAVST